MSFPVFVGVLAWSCSWRATRVFPVRLRSFAVASLGGPFVVLGDVVESEFADVRENACLSVLVE